VRSRLRKLLNLVRIGPASPAQAQRERDSAAELRQRLDQTQQRLKQQIPSPD
jgi:hypothetical protein